MSAPDAPEEQLPMPRQRGVRVLFALYAVTLTALGGWLCFSRLDQGMFNCDEASFAYTTDRMLRTGDWVVPYIHERGPHLNAAPLYNWLCNLTVPLFGESYLGYRIWSAAFGVGCALATLVLGTLLFRAEVGFVAGLLLLGNFYFVFLHGARWCVMEPALTFFVTAMAACYVRAQQVPRRGGRAQQVPRRGGLWWAFTGLCLGLAVLTKPPAMGGFFFVMMCLHHLITRRDVSWKMRLLGPLAAGLVAAVVSLPWYGMIFARLGLPAIDQLFLANSVRRATIAAKGENLLPATFYVDYIWDSSWGFRCALVGLAWGAACVLVGWQRRSWSLLVLLTVPFLLVISNAVTKHHHYAYAAFPFLALTGAGMLFAGFSPRQSGSPRCRCIWRGVTIAGVIAAAFVARHDFRFAKWFLYAQRWEYPALLLHKTMEADLTSGNARLMLYRFPATINQLDRSLGFTAHDRYYVDRMPHAVVVRSVPELNQLLADGKPTVVVLPPKRGFAEQLTAEGLQPTPDRSLLVHSELFGYTVLTFHDAEAKLGLGELLREIGVAPGTTVPQP